MNFKDINPRMCNFCGSCVSVCNQNCLSIENEKISFDENRCSNCSLCYNNCQGIEFDFPKARELFKQNNFHEILGYYDSIYVGQSKTSEILETSSSGGLVPEFLIHALEKKLINGVVMVLKDHEKPLGYRLAIARNKKQVLERCQSLYRLVPINSILKKLETEDNLAFVGLPCQVEAVRKLQMNGNVYAKKIKLIVGIFCGLNQSFESIKFLLNKLNIKEDEVIGFSQRKKDFNRNKFWPGGFYIKTKNNREYFLTKDMYEFLYYKYASLRCLVCYDYTNEFADVSFGDAWSKKHSKKGWSEIIIRSEEAKKIVLGLQKENKIILEQSNLENIMKFHPGHINLKKKGIFQRFKKLGLRPEYHISERQFDMKTEYSQALTFMLIRFIRSKFMNLILLLLPLKLIGLSTSIFRKTLRIFFFKKKKIRRT